MKKLLPYIMGFILLAAFAAGMLLLANAGKKKDTGFEGASFVLSEDDIQTVPAVRFVSGGCFV